MRPGRYQLPWDCSIPYSQGGCSARSWGDHSGPGPNTRCPASRHRSVQRVACGNVGSPRHAALATTAVCRATGWKRERVSESERHGTVNYNSAALSTRRGRQPRGRWGLLTGPSTVTTTPAGLASRTPSPTQVILPELGQVAPPARPPGRGANRPDGTRRADRHEGAAEDRGPSQGPG